MLTTTIVALVALWLLFRFDAQQSRQRVWDDTLGPLLARCQAEDRRRDAERAHEEAERTQWMPKDGGWDLKRRFHPYRELPVPDQPWNYRWRWQGLVHSSGRAGIEQRNAEYAERARQRRDSFLQLRRLAA